MSFKKSLLKLTIVLTVGLAVFFAYQNYKKICNKIPAIDAAELQKLAQVNIVSYEISIGKFIELKDDSDRLFYVDAVAYSALAIKQLPKQQPFLVDILTNDNGKAIFEKKGNSPIKVFDIVINGQSSISLDRMNELYSKNLDSNYFMIGLAALVVLTLCVWQLKKLS